MINKSRFWMMSVTACALLIGAFALMLSPQSANAYAQSTAQATSAATSAATIAATPSDPVAARGQYLVEVGACADCHGNAKLNGALAGGNEFKLGPLGTFYSANLTVLQDWTTDDFLKALHQGIEPKSGRTLSPAMPYANYHGMSDADVAAIGTYLKSLTPVTNDVPAAQPGPVAAVALHPLPAVSVPVQKPSTNATYGQYLVEVVSGCGDCHSAHDQNNQLIANRKLSGGNLNLGSPANPLYGSPIVGSVLTAEGYTEASFAIAMRTGIRPWGSQLPPAMPWRHFATYTDNDLTAIWNFLKPLKLAAPYTSK